MKWPILLGLAGVAVALGASGFETETAEWRAKREASLRRESGWLSLIGLFWLHDGANSFGRDAASEIVLPDGPAHAGVFELHGNEVTLATDGQRRMVKPDSDDVVKLGRLSLLLIERGGKFGIRVKDPESPARREFHGIDSFPAREEYRVRARFISQPRQIPILNVLGQTEASENPGYAEFRLGGQELKLYPILEEPGAKELFYIFRDLTSGKETYGAGRFLYSSLPENGEVVIDFNQAYNPPCAFTPYATCPLPPPENRLPLRIEAGEKKYGR